MATDPEATKLQQLAADAYVQLQIDIVVEAGSPSAKNAAAVKALQERYATAIQNLNEYLAAHNQPTAPVLPALPVLGVDQGTSTLPPGVGNVPIGIGVVTGGPLTGTILQQLQGYFSGDNADVAAYIDAEGDQPAVPDAWNYFVKQVDEVFTDFEGVLEDTTATAFGVETGITVAEIGAGTTAEIAGWEVIAFGFGIILSEYITGWILQHASKGFPNPSIFGWKPLNFILDGITNVGNQLTTAAEDQADVIVNVLIQPVRMLVGLFGRAINAIAGAHDKTARIVQHTVPTALGTAKTYTDEQLNLQQQAIEGDATTALDAMTPPPDIAQAHQIIADANLYQTLPWKLEALAAAAIIAAGTYTDNTNTDTKAEIATAKAQAEADAQAAIQSEQATLISQLAGNDATLSALVNSINVNIPEEIATQVNENNATENQALQAQITPLQSQITSLQSQITTLANQNATATTSIATATAALNDLQSETTLDEGAIAQQQQIITAAQSVITANTTAISDLYTQITGISDTLGPIQAAQTLQASQITTLNTDLDIAIPTAIAALSTQITSLKTQVDECSVDNCDPTNPNNIRNVLRDLLGLLTAAGEIGFIAEAINDPTGTANALAPILDSLDSSAIATLDALLSL